MASPGWKSVKVQMDGTIATLALHRPEKSNALNHDSFREIPEALAWIQTQPSVRVVVLTGSGRSFCAGIDLSIAAGILATIEKAQCPSRAREQLRQHILHMQDALTACEQCSLPVIAAVQGHCIGAGIDLATACDIRCCTDQAAFCVKEIDLGITADLGTLQRLFRLVGEGRSRELALTAETFSGQQALQWGLVTHSFPNASALTEGVGKLAAVIAAKSPVATYGTKQICLHSREHTVAEGLHHVAVWNSAQLVSSDMHEAFAAMKAKRAPQYMSRM